MIGCLCETCTSQDPHDKRLRTSAHIVIENKHIQIDIGPDFRQQMLTHGVQMLDGLILTHQHSDHTSGLDEIRAFNFIKEGTSIPLYAEQYLLDDLRTRFAYIFSPKDYPGLPLITLHKIESNSEFNIDGINIMPIKVIHGRQPIVGYRIQNFAYITDASLIPKESIIQLRNLDVLIINALRKKVHHSHFNLAQSLKAIEEINPKKAYITHISHQMGRHKIVESELPENVFLAFDGLTLEI